LRSRLRSASLSAQRACHRRARLADINSATATVLVYRTSAKRAKYTFETRRCPAPLGICLLLRVPSSSPIRTRTELIQVWGAHTPPNHGGIAPLTSQVLTHGPPTSSDSISVASRLIRRLSLLFMIPRSGTFTATRFLSAAPVLATPRKEFVKIHRAHSD